MNKNYLMLLLSLVLSLSFSAFSEAQEMSHGEFLSVKATSEQLLKICPPEKCVIIGIGRSPTPVMAYLDEESNDNIWSIPLSGFRHKPNAIAGNDKVKLFEHFDKFLPTISQLHGRSVLLLDYSCSGASLVAAQHYIKEYYRSKDGGHETVVDMSALVSSETYDESSIDFRIPHVIALPSGTLADKLISQSYDCKSAYGAYYIHDSPISNTLRDGYKELRQNFKDMKGQNIVPQEYDLKYHKLQPYISFDESLSDISKRRIVNNLDRYPMKDIEKNIALIMKDPSQEIKRSLADTILRFKNLEEFQSHFLKFFEGDQPTSELAILAILNSLDTVEIKEFREAVLEKILTHKDEKNRDLALNATLRLFSGSYMASKQALKLIQTALTGPDEKFLEKVMEELSHCYEYRSQLPCRGSAILEKFSKEEQNSIFESALNSKSSLAQAIAKAFLDPHPQFDVSLPLLVKNRIIENLDSYPMNEVEKNVALILKDPSLEIRQLFARSVFLRYRNIEEFMPFYLKLFEEDQPTSELAIQAIMNSHEADDVIKFREAVLEKILTHKDEKNRDLALNATLRLFAGAYMTNKQAVKLIQTALIGADEKFSEKVMDELTHCYHYRYKEPCIGPAILERFSEAEQDSIYQAAFLKKAPLPGLFADQSSQKDCH